MHCHHNDSRLETRWHVLYTQNIKNHNNLHVKQLNTCPISSNIHTKQKENY